MDPKVWTTKDEINFINYCVRKRKTDAEKIKFLNKFKTACESRKEWKEIDKHKVFDHIGILMESSKGDLIW